MRRGIYAIRNTANKRVYVGLSIHIERRWALHRARLNSGLHHNRHLQADWVQYGRQAFTFEVLEDTPPNVWLLHREAHYIKKLKADYNAPTANPDSTFRSIRLSNWMWAFLERMGDGHRGLALERIIEEYAAAWEHPIPEVKY